MVPVQVDWDCPRDTFYAVDTPTAEGFAPPDFLARFRVSRQSRNLHGISFAVANMTGFVARCLEHETDETFDEVIDALGQHGRRLE